MNFFIVPGNFLFLFVHTMRISAKSLALFSATSTMQLVVDLPVASAQATLLKEVVPAIDKIDVDGLQHW